MKLFYFPFTHVPQQDRNVLGAFFRKVYYLSSESWHGLPSGQPRGGNRFSSLSHGNKETPETAPLGMDDCPLLPLPFPGEMRDPVMRTIADYRQWAIHSGAGPGQLKSLFRKTPYFTSDTQVDAILSQIKGGLSPEKTRAEDPCHELMKALVFLCLAGERDAQATSVDAALSTVDEKTDRLFSTLAGEEPTASPEENFHTTPLSSDPLQGPGENAADPGAVMTSSRISSWFRVFQAVGGASPEDGPWVFITTSPAVLAFFEEIAPEGERLIDKGVPVADKDSSAHSTPVTVQVMEELKTALSGPNQNLTHGELWPGQLNLYLFKGAGIKKNLSPHDEDGEKGLTYLPLSWMDRGIFVCFIPAGK